jgi:hypothetical protein
LDKTKEVSPAQPGNDLELMTQSDGATVGIREASQYVKAELTDPKLVSPTNKDKRIEVKALDYTSLGMDDEIQILANGGKSFLVKKKYVKLLEYGVYNSEMDIANKVGTDENKPDRVAGVLDKVTARTKEILADIVELKKNVEEGSNLSTDSYSTCIAELESFIQVLQDQANDISAESVN